MSNSNFAQNSFFTLLEEQNSDMEEHSHSVRRKKNKKNKPPHGEATHSLANNSDAHLNGEVNDSSLPSENKKKRRRKKKKQRNAVEKISTPRGDKFGTLFEPIVNSDSGVVAAAGEDEGTTVVGIQGTTSNNTSATPSTISTINEQGHYVRKDNSSTHDVVLEKDEVEETEQEGGEEEEGDKYTNGEISPLSEEGAEIQDYEENCSTPNNKQHALSVLIPNQKKQQQTYNEDGMTFEKGSVDSNHVDNDNNEENRTSITSLNDIPFVRRQGKNKNRSSSTSTAAEYTAAVSVTHDNSNNNGNNSSSNNNNSSSNNNNSNNKNITSSSSNNSNTSNIKYSSSTSSSYTPTTPVSPSRAPFQSISTCDALTQSLEETAAHSSKNTRQLVWKEWAILIREAETNSGSSYKYLDDNYHSLTFKEVFLKSKVLEKIVESVLQEPDLSSESELWELFARCLIGDEDSHYKLIVSLRKLGELLKGQKSKLVNAISKVMCNLISDLKIKPDQQKILFSSLRKIDNKLLEKLERSSKEKQPLGIEQKVERSLELLRLWEQKRDLLLSFSKRCSSKSVTNTSNSSFAQLENMFNTIQSNSSMSMELRNLAEQHRKNEQEIKQKIIATENALQNMKDKEKMLVMKKQQLEQELSKVNEELNSVKKDKDELKEKKEDFEKELKGMNALYKRQNEELVGLNGLYMTENENLVKLRNCIMGTRKILSSTLERRSDVFEEQLKQCNTQYLEQVGNYLIIQNQRLLDILTNKIAKLCEKLTAYRLRRQAEIENPDKVKEYDAKIRKNYRIYIHFSREAEKILRPAEEYNRITHDLNEFSQYGNIVRKHIDPALNYLSQSEEMILQFNERLTWVEKEILGNNNTPNQDLHTSSDTDCSCISEISVNQYRDGVVTHSLPEGQSQSPVAPLRSIDSQSSLTDLVNSGRRSNGSSIHGGNSHPTKNKKKKKKK